MLVDAYRDQGVEVAKLRFRLNFATPQCEHCDGLRAGPGVVATCFQMQQCHYDNFKGEGTAQQRGVLDSLFGGKNNP